MRCDEVSSPSCRRDTQHGGLRSGAGRSALGPASRIVNAVIHAARTYDIILPSERTAFESSDRQVAWLLGRGMPGVRSADHDTEVGFSDLDVEGSYRDGSCERKIMPFSHIVPSLSGLNQSVATREGRTACRPSVRSALSSPKMRRPRPAVRGRNVDKSSMRENARADANMNRGVSGCHISSSAK